MEKQLLLKNILFELNELPDAYLRHWYELIHTFREKLPVQESLPAVAKPVDFDWDDLVNDVMNTRRQNNLQRMSRMANILES